MYNVPIRSNLPMRTTIIKFHAGDRSGLSDISMIYRVVILTIAAYPSEGTHRRPEFKLLKRVCRATLKISNIPYLLLNSSKSFFWRREGVNSI